LGAGSEIGIYECDNDNDAATDFYWVNPFNILKADIKLDYLYEDPGCKIDYPRAGRRESHGDGENWWVCVFNKNAKFPKVIENTQVTQTVSFKGFDVENNKLWDWLGDYALTLPLFPNGIQALSIPPSPAKLWEKFRKAMFETYSDEKEMANHGLFLDGTNKFRLVFNKDTNK